MREACVFVRQAKAYVPTVGLMKGGGSMSMASVFTAQLTVEGLTRVLEEVLAAGNPQLPPLGKFERPRPDPVLKAAGVRSWHALARAGAGWRHLHRSVVGG